MTTSFQSARLIPTRFPLRERAARVSSPTGAGKLLEALMGFNEIDGARSWAAHVAHRQSNGLTVGGWFNSSRAARGGTPAVDIFSEVSGSHPCSVGRTRRVIRFGASLSRHKRRDELAPRYSGHKAVIRTGRFPGCLFLMEQTSQLVTCVSGFPSRVHTLRGGVKPVPEDLSFCAPSVLADPACEFSKASEIVLGLHVPTITLEPSECFPLSGNFFP